MISFARNHSELVYRLPLLTRVAGAALAVAVLAFLLVMWPQVLDASLPIPALLLSGALWLMMIAGCVWMALSVRIAFIFGVDGIVSREWWRTRTLPYANIAGCTVVHAKRTNGRGPVVRGYRVTFEAMRRGTPPLCLFVQDGLPLDAAIIRRLKTVPGLSPRQLKLLELASSDHAHSQRMSQTPAGGL
jgi:hypothetical protein